MKAIRYIVSILLILACLGLLGYQYYMQGSLERNQMIRAALIIVGAILSLMRKPQAKVTNKKAVYAKAYSEYIQNAFQDTPKLERQFYDAVHLYNQSKLDKAAAKLEKLRKECQSTAEMRAVTVFTALCLDEMQIYDKAITQYQAALSIRNSSSLRSNMGLCYQRLGNFEEAQLCYEQAIELDPKNAYAINNLSALYFRLGNYDEALDVAAEAIEVNPKMRQALTTAAICCGILGYEEDYQQYYRQAVANGADGKQIKEIIKNLDPCL
jgi:tetratricopeptide (TPR) repeat protein